MAARSRLTPTLSPHAGRGSWLDRHGLTRRVKKQRNAAAMMIDLETLEAAAALVHRVVPPTPQYCWPLLSRRAGAQPGGKHENHTPTRALHNPPRPPSPPPPPPPPPT